MSGLTAQAAGLAVGAAVGAFAAGPGGAVAGANIGAGVGGGASTLLNNKSQTRAERAALKLNQAQAHAKAADAGARHAQSFRQALASQVSLANLRGGAGSLTTQFGAQAFESFAEDQKMLELGVAIGDTQTALGLADASARSEARPMKVVQGVVSAFDSVNISKTKGSK